MPRFYNIDFLRFLFAVIISYYHWVTYFVFPVVSNSTFYQSLKINSEDAYLLVDVFFILAGFFLYRKLLATPLLSWKTFMVGRVVRLWPVLAFSLFLFWLLSLGGIVVFFKYDNLMNLLFLQSSGMAFAFGNNGNAWFVSALFLVSGFYYFLFSRYRGRDINWIVGLVIYFSYVAVLNALHGSLGGTLKPVIWGVFNAGLLRALAGMGLGYFLALWYERYGARLASGKGGIWYTLAEISLFIFLVKRCVLGAAVSVNPIIFILSGMMLLALFLVRRGILSRLLNVYSLGFLGRYAYSVYLMHLVIFICFQRYLYWHPALPGDYPAAVLLVGPAGAIILGAITYHCVEAPICRWYVRKHLKTATK